ncbi:MAG: class II aldolase/adducin family protein [Micromonosporaceae bacterium]
MPHPSHTLVPEREQVAAVCRRLADDGLVLGTAGNVSVRAGELIAVTATGASFAELTTEQVSVVDSGGRLVAGEYAPTSELGLHLELYRRYQTGAIVHTHAPMAVALACVLDELPVIHYQLLGLGGAVRVAAYHTFGTPELAQAVSDALDGRYAALMSNHGAVTHAPTVDKALEHALLLEWGCQIYWHAAALGTPRVLDEEQQQAVAAQARALNYGATRPGAPPAGERSRADRP